MKTFTCAARDSNPEPAVKSPLLCSKGSRYYLRLSARISEDMFLTCRKLYLIMTADARSYRDVRANMELTPVCIGLDHYADRRHGRREKRCQ